MPGFTRQFVRRVIAAELGDFLLAKATNPGTVNTVTDVLNFTKEYNHFRGAAMLFSSGGNTGQLTYASANDPTTRTITFSPAVASATAVGDEIEIYNFHHQGWDPSQINRAINSAIAVAGEQHGAVPAAYQVPDIYLRNSPDIEIPLMFSEFHGISYVDRAGSTKMLAPRYWEVNRYERTVIVKRNGADSMHGYPITLLGMTDPQLADNDSSLVMIPLEWLKNEAKAQILEGETTAGAINSRDRLFNVDRQGADGRRQLVLNRRPPNSVRLR